MRRILFVAVYIMSAIACGGNNSPTAPTPPVAVVVTPPVVTPPVTVTPPVVPAPAFPPTDARFDLTFYRQFVHDAYDSPERLDVLRRQAEAPRIYLRTIDDGGAAMDSFTLNQTAAALESTAGSLTGVFGVAGIERGPETREGQRGWITVRWSTESLETPTRNTCGRALIGGDLITLYPRTPGCRCPGGPAVLLSIVKHELGHALGFRHTDSRLDLMYGLLSSCDQQPSARELYHAALAYQRPIGSPAP